MGICDLNLYATTALFTSSQVRLDGGCRVVTRLELARATLVAAAVAEAVDPAGRTTRGSLWPL